MAQRKNEAIWIESRQRWQIKVQEGGVRKTFTSKIKGKKGKVDAEKQADKWRDDGSKNENIRFGELYHDYVESIDTGHSSAFKKQQEKIGRLYLLPRWEHRKVATLTNRDYQDAIDAAVKRPKPLSVSTCKHIRGAISGAYSYAVSDNIAMMAPYKLKIPKGATEQERKIMQDNDFETLLANDTTLYWGKEVHDFYINAYRLAAIMGYRRGEVCGLKTEDAKNGLCRINRAINREGEETPGKSKKAKRAVVLPPLAIQTLEDQANMLKSAGIISPWVFPNKRGQRTNPHTLYERWTIYRDYHHITAVSFHEIRHSMISTVKNDLPLPMLQQIVGHTAQMDTLGQYGHELDKESQLAANIINDVYSKFIKK